MKILVDESGQIKGRYSHFMVGVLYAYKEREIEDAIQEIRQKHKFGNEIHFEKISNWRFKVYKELLQKILPTDWFWMCILDLPRERLNLKSFSNKPHIAYNFYVKRALQHSIVWGLKEDAYIYFDKRSRTREDNFLSYLELEVKDYLSTKNCPYKIINQFEHIDSKKSQLLQLTDLVLGAAHHYSEGRFKSTQKKELADFVMNQRKNIEIYRWGDRLFNEAG